MKKSKGTMYLIIFFHVFLVLVLGSISYNMSKEAVLGIMGKNNFDGLNIALSIGTAILGLAGIVLLIIRLFKFIKENR